MYELENPRETACARLDAEFDNFRHDPIGYLTSMNWNCGNNFRQWLNLYSDNISYKDKDVDELEAILINAQYTAEDALDFYENGEVNDFLTNCVAGRINKVFDVKKDKVRKRKIKN